MKAILISILIATVPVSPINAEGKVWSDPAKAAAESPDFAVQGEYADRSRGFQVVALGKGNFMVSEYAGGLPGAGWDGSEIASANGDAALVRKRLGGAARIEREVPTLGAKAPAGALVLFDGSDTDEWDGKARVRDGLLLAGTKTKRSFGDFRLHLEFMLPFKPETPPSDQDRGNSGIYIFSRYECQVIDTFGLDFDSEKRTTKVHSDPKQWCGSLYKFRTPDVPMCLPPLVWQSYDIEFTAPKFGKDGKTANARVTVIHNGVKIHDDVELPKGTGNGGLLPEVAEGPIVLQEHGNPVLFRNIWIVGK